MIGHMNTTGEDDLKIAGLKLFGNMFKGVFAADEMTVPRMLLDKQCCICNLSPRASGGSHWIALAQDKDDLLIHDSFGRVVADGDVIHSESDPEQSLLQMNCGQRCLAWLCIFQQFGRQAALHI